MAAWVRRFALVVVLAMVAGISPPSSSASAQETAPVPAPATPAPVPTPVPPVPFPTGESEGWTPFSHSNVDASGETTTELFTTPAFRQTDSGWQPVDRAVRATANPARPAAAEGAFRPIRFGRDASSIVEIELDGGPVTMSAPGLAIGRPDVRPDGVDYRQVATDTDLRYRLVPTGVKEELVLRSPEAPREFTFRLADPDGQLGAVHAQPDGSYRFDAEVGDGVVMGLAAPYAYEEAAPADNARGGPGVAAPTAPEPGSAHMTVVSTGDGFDVTTSVDATWMEGKSFPIVLDPTVTFSHAKGTMLAGFGYGGGSCGGNCSIDTTTSDLAVGTSSDYQPARSFLRFDLSAIPPGSTVSSAELGLYTNGCLAGSEYYCDDRGYTVYLKQLEGAWGSSSTFNQLNNIITTGSEFGSYITGAFTATSADCSTGCFWMKFPVADQVQRWVSREVPNHGFVAKLAPNLEDDLNLGGPAWSHLGQRGTAIGNPPYLKVTHTANAPSPLEKLGGFGRDQLTKHCNATENPVNCATGNFWHTFADLHVPGRGPDLDLNRTVNSLDATTSGPFGLGVSSSYSMSLATASTGVVTLRQENGSRVTFSPTGTGSYSAPPRVLASLVKNANGTFTFTRRQRERFVFSSAGKLMEVLDLNGYAVTLGYDTSGKLITATDASGRALVFAYGTNGLVKTVTDPAVPPRQVTYTYEASEDPMCEADWFCEPQIGPDRLKTVTDVGGGVTRFGYDSSNRVTGMTDPRGGVVVNVYDASSRVLSQTDAMARTTTFAYQSAYPTTTTTITDPRGHVEIQTYTFGVLTALTKGSGTPQAATWRYGYDSPTLGVTTVTDPNGHPTTNTYDERGNLKTVTDALDRTTTMTYTDLNDMETITDPTGVTTTMVYDTGNLRSRSRPLVGTTLVQLTTFHYDDPAYPGDLTSVTDPNAKVWTFAYDGFGNLARETNPLGHATTYDYDLIGRRKWAVSPKGNLAGATPDAFKTTYGHNAHGDVTSVTDPLNHTTTMTYDLNRNLETSRDANLHTTTYTYNANDELTLTTRPDTTTLGYGYDAAGNLATQRDGLGATTTYTYDPLDRAASTIDPRNRTTTFGYDGAGNRKSLTDPAARVTTFAYDDADQLETITYSNATTPNVGFTYYDTGQRKTMTTGTGTGGKVSTYAYDSLYRLTSASNGTTTAVGYGYDLADNLTSITYPGGTQSVTRGHDDAGRLVSVKDWLDKTTIFHYDENGNLDLQTYPNGTTATRSPDNADRLMGITHARGTTTLLNLGYGRDSANLLRSEGPGTYTYDANDRLKTSSAAPALGYTYDNGDNRKTVTQTGGDTSSYSYNAAHELATANIGGFDFDYYYNSNGNRTAKMSSDHFAYEEDRSYGYDQANRLTNYNGQASYAYDGAGLRSSKTVGTTTTNFTWDLAQGLPLLLQEGTTRYIYGPGGQPLSRIDGSGNALYYHQDQLGSTRLLTNAAGTVAGTATYDPYGQRLSSSGVANHLGYAGQYTDAESGLQYLRARYYDPATAQFLTKDPLVAITQEPYGYVGNNPLNSIDPAGLYEHSLSWRLGSGDSADARAIITAIVRNPDPFFPFSVSGPLDRNATVQLAGQYRLGDVDVSGVGSNWFSFNTRPGHVEGYPASVMFSVYEREGSLYFQVDANGPDGSWQWGPLGWAANQFRSQVSRDLWSHMAMNIRSLCDL